MNLFRSLISLVAEPRGPNVRNKDDANLLQSHQYLSANELTRRNNKSLASFKREPNAYSSINLFQDKNSVISKSHSSYVELSEPLNNLENDESCGIIELCLPSLFNDDVTLNYDTSEGVDLNMSDIGCASSVSSVVDLRADDIQLDIFPTSDFKFMYNIGHGAFGIVHKEFHLKSCQIVAVKSCRSVNANSIKSFKNEIKICREFKQCKYIIDMIECGVDYQTNLICIALEYMNMASLNKNLSIFKYNSLDRARYVSFAVLNALQCLHSKLYIHNDVKPGNILINDHWEVKLSDFGCITQLKDSQSFETKPMGTQYYQSYEKRFVSPIEYNTTADIYSLGITICELLKQQDANKYMLTPFKIPNEIIQKYEKRDPHFIDFLGKCLERNYHKRWSATKLLNHPFITNEERNNCEVAHKGQDIDDLEFMVQTLMEYYSHYTDDKNISVLTPMDNAWSDAERIQNIAKYSGYSLSFVNDFITKNVNDVKNRCLKL